MKKALIFIVYLGIRSPISFANSSERAIPYAIPTHETDPVLSSEDSVDDPAIWIHPTTPRKSLIIGTNKKGGLSTYNLKGKKVHYESGFKLNNIDIRYNFKLKDGEEVDLIAGSDKNQNTLHLFRFNKKTKGVESLRDPVPTTNKAYGLCLYHSIKTNKHYAFITGYRGDLSQYHIYAASDGSVEAELVRTLEISGKNEGCVADDEYGKVYVAEEEFGIWRFEAEPDKDPKGTLIADIASHPYLEADIEGLTLIHTGNGDGYLIASVQEIDQFAVFSRKGANRYLFNFGLKGKKVDDVTHTDGIDIIGLNMGPQFPFGFFIAQDDEDFDQEGNFMGQNFKLTPWESVLKIFPEFSVVDNTWNPRYSKRNRSREE